MADLVHLQQVDNCGARYERQWKICEIFEKKFFNLEQFYDLGFYTLGEDIWLFKLQSFGEISINFI